MSTLSEAMAVLLASGAGADVTVVVGKQRLRAHSLILAARSPVFAAMFDHDTAEAVSSCISIGDVDAVTIEQLLAYIYTDDVPELGEAAIPLLVAADKYDLPLLKEKCEDQLVESLTLENVAECAVVAYQHCCPYLQAAAIELIAQDLRAACNTEGWREGADTCPLLMEEVSRLASAGRKLAVARKMQAAAEAGDVSTLRHILGSGEDVNLQCDNGYTALHKAVKGGRMAAVELLLQSGASVDARNVWQQTPFHVAAVFGRKDAAMRLVYCGADKEAKDGEGQTALQIAAACGEAEVVANLLWVGADASAGSGCGRTPLQLALAYNRRAVVDVLQGRPLRESTAFTVADLHRRTRAALAGGRPLFAPGGSGPRIFHHVP